MPDTQMLHFIRTQGSLCKRGDANIISKHLWAKPAAPETEPAILSRAHSCGCNGLSGHLHSDPRSNDMSQQPQAWPEKSPCRPRARKTQEPRALLLRRGSAHCQLGQRCKGTKRGHLWDPPKANSPYYMQKLIPEVFTTNKKKTFRTST